MKLFPKGETPDEAATQKRLAETATWKAKQEDDARMAIPNTIVALKKEAAEKIEEADRLETLLVAYPDIRKYTGRWKKVAYYSKTVNTQVQRFDLRFNCGCCSDSPLEIWPYLETPHGNVYSDPPSFQVGEKHYMGGARPYEGWKAKMEAVGIPEIIVGAVAMHFERDREARIASASDEGEIDPDGPEPLL